MDKGKAVEELTKRGYEAHKMNGIVMVKADERSYSQVKKVLKEIGYNASWGTYASDDT